MTKDSSVDKRITQLQHDCVNYVDVISKKEHEIANLIAKNYEMHVLLQCSESVGTLSRKLFHKIDNKIMYELTNRGNKKSSVRKSHPKILLTGDESYQDMIGIVKIYDIKESFAFRRRASKNPLRFHYRIAAKSYRTTRDGLLRVGNKLYGMRRKQER